MSDPEELSPEEREAWHAAAGPGGGRVLEQEHWMQRADELRQALLQHRLRHQWNNPRLNEVMHGLQNALFLYFDFREKPPLLDPEPPHGGRVPRRRPERR